MIRLVKVLIEEERRDFHIWYDRHDAVVLGQIQVLDIWLDVDLGLVVWYGRGDGCVGGR